MGAEAAAAGSNSCVELALHLNLLTCLTAKRAAAALPGINKQAAAQRLVLGGASEWGGVGESRIGRGMALASKQQLSSVRDLRNMATWVGNFCKGRGISGARASEGLDCKIAAPSCHVRRTNM